LKRSAKIWVVVYLIPKRKIIIDFHNVMDKLRKCR
jgi:hypothetical protein